jgi:hypothetical protein
LSTKNNRSRLTAALTTRTGQGLLAFFVGAATFFLIGFTLSGFPDLTGFIFNNLPYLPRGPIAWSTGAQV